MSRFKSNEKKETPELNMGSMSDIIFMFLFFFMVITTMREASLKVHFNPPKATEIQKLEKKSLVANIYIGAPISKNENKNDWDFYYGSEITWEELATDADVKRIGYEKFKQNIVSIIPKFRSTLV